MVTPEPASFVKLVAADAAEETIAAKPEPVVSRPAPKTPAPAPAALPAQTTTPKASLSGAASADAETRAAVPPTPVSADLKSRLANVFKKIGEKTTTASGLEDLYDFSKQYPMVDIQPHLARTSAAFQSYIQRGLQKVESARAQRAAMLAAATPRRAAAQMAEPAAPIAPSPMPQMERTAAEVYRERLAAMAASKLERERRLSGGLSQPNATATASTNGNGVSSVRSSAASAGLTTLRERMDRIAAKAAGGVSGGSFSSSRVPTMKTSEQQLTFEDLQARMERIRANASSSGKF
jgi:cytoskeleton-associated protein 5